MYFRRKTNQTFAVKYFKSGFWHTQTFNSYPQAAAFRNSLNSDSLVQAISRVYMV